MSDEFRSNILVDLQGDFSAEQLKTIDLAIAHAMRGYKIEKEETLPASTTQQFPMDIKEFLIRKEMKGCSSGTLVQYRNLLSDFYMFVKKDLREVKDYDILSYLKYRENLGASKCTIDSKRLIISSFYTFMHDTGKISMNPTKTIDRIKFTAKVREPLGDMELEMVRSACQTPRERALFEVLYASGGRVSEVAKMNYQDINQMNWSMIILGKGNKERVIFLNAKAILAIKKYMETRTDSNAALFVTERKPHNRLGKESIERILHKIGERSGIGRCVFPHLLRHTFATNLLSHGAPIEEVSELLGHQKLSTTQIYTKINTSELEHTYRKCHVG